MKVPVEQMSEWDPWKVAVTVVAALEHSLVSLKANLLCFNPSLCRPPLRLAVVLEQLQQIG
jgi:hypothetical protein